MKKALYASLAAAATVVATVMATSACFFWFYQPEEPQSLKEV